MTGTSVDDAFLVANGKGVVVDVNEGGCRLFGRQRDQLIGLSITPHSPPEILGPLGQRWAELRMAGIVHGSAQIDRPDGSFPVDFVAQLDLPVIGWVLIRLTPSALPRQ